ncbi:MAG: glycosyl hydrolase [Ruminococcaceae bacterium]|nr:glycosyl hydrolase [Oscillospiraceae bacterium]
MQYPYQDPALDIEERVKDLLSRMTLREKLAQMRLLFPGAKQAKQEPFDVAYLEENKHCCGAIYNPYSMSVETVNAIQKWYVENTRLGIPIAVHSESLHGGNHETDTVFPQSIGLGAAFHKELIAQIGQVMGKQVKAGGNNLVYAPNLDLSRDPRWGRTEETYGEDPYLTAQYGVAYIKAMQAEGVACCPKHFLAYGLGEGGINLAPAHAGEREMREVLLEPFQKAVTEGGAMGIMPSYGELDGEPLHGSRRLLTELLRTELGFTGQVVSDYGAVSMLRSFHRVAKDCLEAGKRALYAGVDMEAPKMVGFGPELEEAVERGTVPESWVDTAVSRILRHKFQMGLFEDPYTDPQKMAQCHGDAPLALARKAAEETLVLLKNENNILPLSEKIGKVAVIGPNSAVAQLGDYTPSGAWPRAVSVKQGLETLLGEDRVSYALGCTTAGGTEKQLREAVELARQADVAIVCLGDNSNFSGGIGWGAENPGESIAITSGEGFDMCSLELPGRQQKLLEAIWETGTPVVLVLQTGRPYAISWAADHIPAILQAWYPGEQGGHAVADVLFGRVNPSGKLPISMPRSVGHLPVYYNHKASARGFYKKPGSLEKPGRDYVFDTPQALYPFGYGLSYTTFSYRELGVSVLGKDRATVRVTVENTGDRAGFEAVLLYVSDKYCRITPFVRRLRGFEKLWLEPGECKTVAFDLGFEDFAFINENMEPEVESGDFTVTVGDLQESFVLE